MATTFLPPIFPSPFGRAFSRKPYLFSDASHSGSNVVECSRYVDQDSPPQKSRAGSVPINSILSGHPPDSDENAKHCFYPESAAGSPAKRSYSLNAAQCRPCESITSCVRPADEAFGHTEAFPVFDPGVSLDHGLHDMQCRSEANRLLHQPWNCALSDSAEPSPSMGDTTRNATDSCVISPRSEEPQVTCTPPKILNKSFGKTAENFRQWASTFRRKRDTCGEIDKHQVIETGSRTDTPSALQVSPLRHRWHRKRTSNASSRFVATIKTASVSNDSTSLFPRSHRYSRVSDTRANRSSDPRSSVESQRPSSISSSDDGALRRSIKRRQVLQELLSSEESYVADLKALHNLFSTLLASIPTLTTQTRNSIQRNVTDMLQLHEQIIDELHQVALRATLREGNLVSPLLRPITRSHTKWQSLYATASPASTPKRSHTGRSPTDAVYTRRGSSNYSADPAEVAEVARAYKNQMARFFVYEEYSAKYDIMIQEVANSHKMVPEWPSYEAGMEALANSIASLNQRSNAGKKGLTAHDLLIKPIQRICKYPLFFLDLYRHTPVVDCPSTHAEVDGALANFREMVREVNMVTDDPKVRERIQRRWLLQDRLQLSHDALKATQFRMLGHVLLCGVLHVAYQSSHRVEGGYMLCVMFKDYLLVAAPAAGHAKFDIVATIYLSDAKVVSTEDGKGLQCHTALFSWKVLFESDSHLFELMFSACSATEQQQWLAGVERGRSLLALEGPATEHRVPNLFTTTSLDLKALAPIFSQGGPLARRLSIQRAATVAPKVATCQVIIRNTHKPQDGQELRYSATAAVNRSQSLLTTHRVTILAPKRSVRIRLEQSLADVWTRDTLPFPGMSLTRGGDIIRASAGSLARKFSLASIHSPFTKRSTSLTLVGSRFSHDTSVEVKHEIEQQQQHQTQPQYQDESLGHRIVLEDHDELGEGKNPAEEAVPRSSLLQPSRHSLTGVEKLHRRSGTKNYRRQISKAGTESVPDMSSPEVGLVEEKLRTRRKRWSNPLGVLKNLSTEGMRSLLYSSR
ncbi:hypothetical protein GJ744_004321 [Endocarpon pusillum]|uniref:DH domain-containing protein n=1 Tax=Endocarpon pusillum TaxID=364733 RepID=A0A8H7DYV8_9EURO|nr:hypothetical protein GJ744_004321 [Endocarpon pusillum]